MDKSQFLGLNLPSETDLMQISAISENFEILDANASSVISTLQSSPTESTFQKLMLGKETISMGMEIFMKSGTFDPTKYGLKIGQLIQVLAVGGGGGGGLGGKASSSTSMGCSGGGGGSGFLEVLSMKLETLNSIEVTVGNGGDASTDGEATTFGEYLTALGGKCGTAGQGATNVGLGGDGYCKGKNGRWGSENGYSVKGGRGYLLGESIHAPHTEIDDATYDLAFIIGFGGGGYSGCGLTSGGGTPVSNSALIKVPSSGASGVCIVTW